MAKKKINEPEKKTEKHAGGRPTKYNPAYCLTVEYMARNGMIEIDMAEKLGIAMSTFSLWKETYKEFSEALRVGKEQPDDKVERALFEMATGYEYDAQKPMTISDGGMDGSHIEIITYREKVPPNPTSMIFWLKNRRPEKWRDKQEVEHSGNISVNITPMDEKL